MSKKKKKFEIKLSTVVNLSISMACLLLAGGIGVFLAFYNTHSPQKYMDEYYECFINESYSALFKSSGVSEDRFISTENFARMMVNEYGYEETDKYSIGNLEKEGEFANATVSFVDSESLSTVKWNLKLQKSAEKKYIFFNEWNVNIDEFILNNIIITADEEIEIIIDDINITTEEIEGVKKVFHEKTGLITYTIERMFKGTHSLILAGKHTMPESELVIFDEDNRSYIAGTVGVVETAVKDSLYSVTRDIIVEVYNSAFAEEAGENLVALFSSKEGVAEQITEAYNGILSQINKEDGSMLISIDITDYSISFEDYTYNEQLVSVFDYTAAFTAKTGRTLGDGVRKTYEGTVNSQAKVIFEYVEDSWQAVDIDMNCIDYSQPEDEEQQ